MVNQGSPMMKHKSILFLFFLFCRMAILNTFSFLVGRTLLQFIVRNTPFLGFLQFVFLGFYQILIFKSLLRF